MNRAELIAKLAGRKSESAPHNPKGLAHPGERAISKPVDRKRGMGVLLSGSWGPINRPRGLRYEWVHEKDPKPERRHVPRHETSPLTRIAEKLKRGWHR